MKKNISSFLSFAAIALYSLLFGGIFIAVTFNNVIFDYRMWLQLALLAGLTVCAAGFLYIYRKFYPALIKHRYKILAVFCITLFAIQMYINNSMVPTLIYDHEQTLKGAIAWAAGGSDMEWLTYHADYLHRYPFQAGLILIQRLLFRLAAAVGYTNFFMVACISGNLLFILMTVTTFIYLDENFNSHRALFYLVLSAMYIPFYFQGSVSYTDTYSIWGIPCLLLFATRALKADNVKKRLAYSLLSGILRGLAMQIKTTALIVLIGLIIQLIVNGAKKHQLGAVAVILATLAVTNMAFDNWAYSTILDKDRDDESMPLTHWVMMGLQGDGSYSYIDEFNITLAVPADQRVAVNTDMIKQRLEEMGPGGYMQLLYKKTCRTFGSGNRDLRYSYCYVEYPQPINLVYDIVLLNGRFYGITNNLSQAVYLLVLLLGAAGGAIMLVKKSSDINTFAPYISLIGFWIFMMLWESNHRQLINQWSLLFIAGAVGLYHIWKLAFKIEE